MTDRKFTHPDDAPEGHEWVTFGGKRARIYATDGGNNHPIHGAVMYNGEWRTESWGHNGQCDIYSGDGPLDLVDKPRTHTLWVNVYQNSRSALHESRQEADSSADASRIACVPVTYTEGEGLGDD